MIAVVGTVGPFLVGYPHIKEEAFEHFGAALDTILRLEPSRYELWLPPKLLGMRDVLVFSSYPLSICKAASTRA
jgi:hypothetical protein